MKSWPAARGLSSGSGMASAAGPSPQYSDREKSTANPALTGPPIWSGLALTPYPSSAKASYHTGAIYDSY